MRFMWFYFLKVSKNTLTLKAQRGEKVINSRQTIVGRGFALSPHNS